MPSKSSLAATVVAALLTLLLGGVLGVFQFESASAAGSPAPGTGLLRFGNSYSLASGPDRYAYVLVGRGDATKAAALPGKSLVYHSGTSVNTIWDTGVPYSVANANGWLLKDSTGAYLKNVNYPDNYIGDVGSSAYQAEWARRVGDYLASVGADGVYIDDVIADIYAMSAKYPTKYPDQVSWENAMASFIASIGPTLKARGFYVLINAHKFISGNVGSNNGSLEAQFWQRLGPSVSGLHNEYFMQSATNTSQFRGEGTAWYDNWSGWANLITVAQSMGRDFVGLTYGSTTNVQAMRYVRATHLLFWNGAGGALTYQVSNGDPWHVEWTIAIGTPTASRYQVGSGWRREYTGGTVLVNPSLTVSQTFALGAAYLMPDGSSVTSVTLAPKSGLVLRSSGSGTASPSNTALPTLSGTPQEGLVQASTSGTWSGSPTSYAYRWHRCDTAGGACGPITGATASQYLLTTTDVGKTVRAEVTASNSGGSTVATSAASAVVASAPVSTPANTSLPAISGTAQQASTLSVSTGSWSNSPTSYAYQWQRCDSVGGACASISGATGSSFALTSVDVGKTLRAAVTASNAGGSTAATSAASAVVTSAPVSKPMNTALPAITGTAQQGSTFSTSTGSWSGAPTSYAYQWQRCDSTGAGCAAISGATGSSFGLTSADVGKTFRVVVTASNAGGSTAATSAASAVVAPLPGGSAPVNTAIPIVTGSKQVGKTVDASIGSWTGNPTSYAYQWLRCSGMTITSCVAITGATMSSYTHTSADEMKMVIVRVTATNPYGSSSSTSKIAGHVVK